MSKQSEITCKVQRRRFRTDRKLNAEKSEEGEEDEESTEEADRDQGTQNVLTAVYELTCS